MQHFGAAPAIAKPAESEPRSLPNALGRGLAGQCPACGRGRLFKRFLKPVEACGACQTEMHHHRADDLPPYLVIFIVGHVVVGAWMMTETLWTLSSWQHLALWVPLTVVAALALMQPVKGAVIGLQWALGMHGFDPAGRDPADPEAGDGRP